MKTYRKDRDLDAEQIEQQIPISMESEDSGTSQININSSIAYNPPRGGNYYNNNNNRAGFINPSTNINNNTSLGRQQPNPYYATNRDTMETLTTADLKYNASQFQSLNKNEKPLYVPPYLLANMRPNRRQRDHNTPADYLPWSIANIFICVLFALPALFFSIQTREYLKTGDIKKAKENSKRSLIFNIVGSVVGVGTILLALILRFALYQLFVHNDIQSYNVPIAGG
jgi:hypothetical protein